MLHEEQTPYQKIQIADTLEYGRLLILDGVFQTSVKDEWTYHEMISHVPLMLHPNPERVLIIGGGDGQRSLPSRLRQAGRPLRHRRPRH